MERFLELVASSVEVWGYPAIIVGMALESACIPVPSEVIFGVAGFLVYKGQLNLVWSVAAGVLGGLIGSIVAFAVGYYEGPPFVKKYGRYILLSEHKLEIAQQWFDRYGVAAVFFSRLLPVIRTFISLPAGFARMNFTKFVVYTILGSVPWTIVLIYFGMLLGENWQTLHKIGNEAGIVVVLVLAAAGYYWYRKSKSK